MTAEVLTFGCRLNAYESQVMSDLTGGLKNTIVVNTCAVTGEAERQARQTIRRLARERPDAKIVATGCAVQINPSAWSDLPNVTRVLGNADKLRPESWIEHTASRVTDINDARGTSSHQLTEFKNRARAFVQVQQGCDHRCTFCIIPFGRGRNRSAPVGQIVDQIRALVAEGHKEVVFTGVDIASYGSDLPEQPTLGQMARQVLANIPELPRLRLSSIDPAAIDEDLWRLIGEEPRLMPHLHLSIQAASDLILKRMRRRHLVADLQTIIERARKIRPEIAIGADLIAGFPTETDLAFQETLGFVKRASLPYLHVFPFSERPGTPAARMPTVPVAVRKERAAVLREEGKKSLAAFLRGMLGRRLSILMESDIEGHSEHFVSVRMRRPVSANRMIDAIVTDTTESSVMAEAV
jgi:threonylcarbamoyladenosine tRNA methylthiotransferase MtaB